MPLQIVSSTSAECIEIREQVSGRQYNHVLLLEAYRDRKEGWKHGDKEKEHFVDCPSCLDWLGTQVEESLFVRARDAAEYCCLSMYMAVEETDPERGKISRVPKEKVRFSLWRGEDPTWTIGPNGCNISHCPWCGKRLPNSPFRPSYRDF